ncbi:MAG: MBL fold metallo-hydrolase [Candidatus Bathyarchaeia archaeon]|jgi:glyoxylase-like metal-dependent hydrolase (beta-lactamase superfamily II)
MHTEISDGVFLIDTLAAGAPGLVAGYLIKGKRSALVDAGYPSSANSVLSELKSLVDTEPSVDYLIPTHVHLDHAGAIGHLSEAMPKARVLVNEHGLKHLVDPSKLAATAASLFGKEAMSAYGTPKSIPRERLEAVQKLYELDLGAGKDLRIFYTPGHAWHHISVLLESERLLITGDAVGVRYSGFDFPIPATPPPGFDEEQYVKALKEFINMEPAVLLLPHFGLVRQHIRAFLETNLETIQRWTSMAAETVKAGKPADQLFEAFMADVLSLSGLGRHEIPDHVTRSIKLSAMGCYAHAQEKTIRQ